MPLPRHDAGDGVQTVPECCEAMASVACRALSDRGHARYGLQGWSTSRAERRVSPAYTTLDNNSRAGRPPKVTCALARHLDHLVDQDPLEHGSSHSQWSCQELATVLARQTGVHLSRESVREVLKKRRQLQPSYRAARSCPC